MTYLPGFDVSVVTLSADSPEAKGYCDVAIGWFDGRRTDDHAGVHEVIVGYWQRSEHEGLQHWQEFLREGLIGESEAQLWAEDAWVPQRADEEKLA